MAKDLEETRKYDVIADELFFYCRQAIETIKFRTPEMNPALGIIHALKINKNLKYEITISPVSDQESTSFIKAYSVNGFGGRVSVQHHRKVRKNVNDFFQVLDTIVRRAKIQYG